MRLIHTGILVSSPGNAEEFFGNLLGLSCSRKYIVPCDLMSQLFGIERETEVFLYDVGDEKIEVFIGPESPGKPYKSCEDGSGHEKPGGTGEGSECGGNRKTPSCSVNHLCLRVDDREALMERALALGFCVYNREREGKPNLVFFYDNDGNPFEIVE